MDEDEKDEKEKKEAAEAAAEPEAASAEPAAEEPQAAEPADGKPEEPKAEEATEAAAEEPKEASAPDWKAMYARTMADFDNFRKRTARDREELFKSAAADILKDLLPTVDNLALALDKAADKEDQFVKGVQLVYDGLVKMLADHGAVPVDSLGEPLDTNFHEAIAMVPGMGDDKKGKVIDCVQTGYTMNDKVIRFAKVAVGQ